VNKTKQHRNNLKLHTKNKTVPSQLDFANFPEPLFKHDRAFVDKFEELIKRFQTEIITLTTEHLDNKLQDLEDELMANKQTLNHHIRNDDETNRIMTDLQIEVERSLKKDSDRSFQKVFRKSTRDDYFNRAFTPRNNKRQQPSKSPEDTNTSNYTCNEAPNYKQTSNNRQYVSTPAPITPFTHGQQAYNRRFSTTSNNTNQNNNNNNYQRNNQYNQHHSNQYNRYGNSSRTETSQHQQSFQ